MKRKNSSQAYWKNRSKRYNNLKWAKNVSYTGEFVKAGNFKKKDVVLDVGTGTGIIAHSVAPHVKQVIGLDKSQDMLEHSNWSENKYFIRRNILDPIFAKKVFDKLTCRQVFHHILKKRQKAMDMCYQMLKPGGMMIFSEGVPPTKRVKNDYIRIFKLKEKRVTFYEEDLVRLMKKSGFKKIKVKILKLKNMSIKNWLSNNSLPKKRQKKIYMLHKNASDHFKQDYNMVETKNDCLIEMKMAIVKGIR